MMLSGGMQSGAVDLMKDVSPGRRCQRTGAAACF
jgi:hypothetical protein